MSPIVTQIEIARSPQDVFAYATDPAHFSEWQDDVVAAGTVTDGPLGVGSRFTTTRRIGRTNRTMTQEVRASNAPTRWAARGVDGPLRANVELRIEPLDDGARSRITVMMDFRGEGVGRVLVPVLRTVAARRAPQSYQHLKARLERPGG